MWGLILIAISIINIHSCDINVYNRTTYAVCEDKLIWFISDYLVDAGYESIRNWDGVPTTSGDIFCQVKTHKPEPPLVNLHWFQVKYCLWSVVLDYYWALHTNAIGNNVQY